MHEPMLSLTRHADIDLQSQPKVNPKSAYSQPKVVTKSAKSRPKVGPKSNQKLGISTTGPSAEIPDLADRSALMRECHSCRG